jgi:hypothetical protein
MVRSPVEKHTWNSYITFCFSETTVMRDCRGELATYFPRNSGPGCSGDAEFPRGWKNMWWRGKLWGGGRKPPNIVPLAKQDGKIQSSSEECADSNTSRNSECSTKNRCCDWLSCVVEFYEWCSDIWDLPEQRSVGLPPIWGSNQ